MIERFRILLEEIFIKLLTIAVKMLTKLKRVVLFILKTKALFNGI